jgi:pimeloyl-ACP methyl ester carboxylesterase
VHGLSSNARVWDGVARRLAAADHEVVAVDLRGHGRSEQTVDGYSTQRAAADLSELCEALQLVGGRAPVVAGQSWGGNVVVSLAANHGGVAGLGLVDGGWIALGDRFATFEECWAALAPPVFTGMTLEDFRRRLRGWHPDWPDEGIEGTLGNVAVRADGTVVPRLAREHHKEILRSMWTGDPRRLYEHIHVPVLLAPAVAAGEPPDAPGRAGPSTALELLPDATVSWYEGGDHDLHAQQPDRLAEDLLALVDRAEAAGR